MVEDLARTFRSLRLGINLGADGSTTVSLDVGEATAGSSFTAAASTGGAVGPGGAPAGPLPGARANASPKQRAAAAASPAWGGGAPSASHVTYHLDQKAYVVLGNPYQPHAIGLWIGPAARTWKALAVTLKGELLEGSGAKLRRVESKEAAEVIWRQAFGREGPNL
jgi:hypothetical protein